MTHEPTSGVEAARQAAIEAIQNDWAGDIPSYAEGLVDTILTAYRAALATPAASPATATCNGSLQVESIPRAENTGRYLAETNDGRLLYLNHANQWQEMPNILRTPPATPSPAPAAVEELVARLRKRLKHASPNDRAYERPMSWEDADTLLTALAKLAAERDRQKQEADDLRKVLVESLESDRHANRAMDAAINPNGEKRDFIPAARELHATLAAAEARASALEVERDRLREALEPFAKHYGPDYPDLDHEGQPLPEDQDVGWTFLKIGDFRRARAALSAKETTGE